MLSIDLKSPVPLHEQVKSGLRELLMKGQLKPGDTLPDSKELAESLLVSPQIVSRAYHDLVKEGFLNLTRGETVVISPKAGEHATRDLGETVQQLIAALELCRSTGLSWPDIESIVELIAKQDTTGKEQVLPAIFKRLYFDSGTTAGRAVCPYCRESVSQDAVFCLLCKTLHHLECWEESGRCSVYGCKGKVKFKR